MKRGYRDMRELFIVLEERKKVHLSALLHFQPREGVSECVCVMCEHDWIAGITQQ